MGNDRKKVVGGGIFFLSSISYLGNACLSG